MRYQHPRLHSLAADAHTNCTQGSSASGSLGGGTTDAVALCWFGYQVIGAGPFLPYCSVGNGDTNAYLNLPNVTSCNQGPVHGYGTSTDACSSGSGVT